MKRRQFLSALAGAATAASSGAWPLAAHAQQQPKTLRVGFVGMQPRQSPLYANFVKRMAELGYQEGYRELAARNIDLFLAVGNEPALRAALSAA